MAEQLGEAVLKITVDDSLAKQKLAELRKEITNASGGAGGRTAGGARESTQALERAQSRRFALAQRIERLEERGANVSRLRARLGDLTTAQSQRQFGTARQLSVELDRQVKLANARFRREQDIAAVIARQARLGGPRESVTGRRGLQGSPADLAFLARQGGARSPIGGAANIPGSPAFLAAQKRAGEIQARAYVTEVSRLARQGGARSPIGGAVDIPGSPAFLAAQRRFSAQELSRAAAIGGPRSPIGGAVNLSGSPAAIKAEQQLAEARAKAAKAANDAAVAEGRRIGKLNASPVKGGTAFPGSPEFISAQFPAFPKGFKGQTLAQEAAARSADFEKRLTEARKRSALATAKSTAAEQKQARADLQGRISSGLIGGAFPLLFGQGPGAALGGLAGGVAGGGAFGFGASLVGTGIGASFDALIARSKELAEALRDPIASFDQLKAASVLSSRGLETYIDALIKTGQTAKAEQLIRADLTQNVNPTTAAALSQANDEVARSFSDVQEKLSALVAGPAIAFLEWLDEIIDRLPIQGPGGAAPGQLPSLEAARAQTEAGRQTQGIGLGLGAAALGSILAGIGLTATGVGAPAGLAALTYGLTSAAAVAVGSGKVQQSQGAQAETDIQTQQATASIQKEIEAIQARRVALQKQLVGFTGNENSAGAQLAQTQNVLLNAQEAILRARKEYVSIPVNSTPDEEARAFQAYKDAVAAARLEVEKLIAANNNQARNLKRDTDLAVRTTGFTPAAQQEAKLTDQLTRAREDYDKALQALSTASPAGLKAAQSDVNILGQKWRDASQNINEYKAQQALVAQRQREINADTLAGLQQSVSNIGSLRSAAPGPERDRLAIQLQTEERVSEAKREQIRLQNEYNRLLTTGTKAEQENAAAAVDTASAKTRLAQEQGNLQLQEFAEQTSRASAAERQSTLESAMADAMARAQEAAGEFANAGQRMQEASNNVRAAADGLRAAREGAFEFLRPDVQRSLVDDARAVYQQVSDFRALPTNLSDQEVLRAGNAARSILGAQDQMTKANSELVEATRALADKDWSVNVNVQGGSASAYGDVVNQAVSA